MSNVQRSPMTSRERASAQYCWYFMVDNLKRSGLESNMKTVRGSAPTSHGGLSFLSGGDGPALLFLHGVPGSSRAWEAVVARLDGSRRLVVPDLLGFGGSDDSEDLHAQAQAAAIIELLEALRIERATVITHDFGGPVALRMIDQRPGLVDGLLLSATNAFGDTPIPFPLSMIFWPVVGPLAANAIFSPSSLRMMLRTGVGAPRTTLDASAYVGDRRQAHAIRTVFEDSLRRLAELYGPLAKLLPRLDIPTEVVWGDRDPFFTIDSGRRTAAAIPDANLTTVYGAGHFLPAERPDEMVDAIYQLLVRVERQRESSYKGDA